MAETERGGTIEIAGRSLAWRSQGTGPPLLLVNGYAATGADWDPQLLADLAQSFEVICPDNRGVGGSRLGDPDELTVEAMATDLETLLDALEIERAPVVGWSMGGFVAQAFAERTPRRIAALVLLSTDAGGTQTVLAEPQVWAELTDHSGTAREQASRLISLLFPPSLAPEIDRQFGDVVAAARTELSPQTLRAQEAAMTAWHDESQRRLGAAGSPPVLVACGSEDVVIPPANADVLATHWSDCRVEIFDGGGHAFMAQVPHELAALITSFVRR